MMKDFTKFYGVFCLWIFVSNFVHGQNWIRTTTKGIKVQAEPTRQEFICPKNEVIFPCDCVNRALHCLGFRAQITQETLSNLFFHLRVANDLTPGQTLQFDTLMIYGSQMTQLDLTPFMNLRLVDGLDVYHNPNLTSIVGPEVTNVNQGSIQVNYLRFYDCPSLTDSGFRDTLKYFDTLMTGLFFEATDLRGGHYPIGDGSGDLEFLPGLSKFTTLKTLQFESRGSSKKVQISGGQFKRNTHLTTLYFDMTPVTFGDDAFLFDESPLQLLDKTIWISFRGSESIKNEDFENVTRLARSSRPIFLDFERSQIDFLGEKNFKDFLLGHPNNEINLEDCPALVCDERMKWLEDNPEIFRPRILGGECSNDPKKKSIWDTDLIPQTSVFGRLFKMLRV